MRILRITNKQKPVLQYLQNAWQKPDDQDVLTEDIIKWLRGNLHRPDVGLWAVIDNGKVVGCLLAMGPTLLLPSVHIYTAWIKNNTARDALKFFDGPFTDWVRSLDCNEITMCSCSHTSRSWQKRFGFVPYTRMYRKSLEPVNLELEDAAILEEIE